MGFCHDWADHWRYMGAEIKALGHSCAAHPARALFRLFCSPLTVALYWFLITLYFNNVLSVFAERQGNTHNPILEDEGFEELGGFIDAFYLPNYLLYGLVAATFVRFIPIWPCVKPAMTRMIFRRWLAIEGVIFMFRGFSVAMTSVPQPNPQCVSTATGSPWIEGFNMVFAGTHTCGDCMFSGHTAAITLLVLMWTHYSRGEELTVFTGDCCRSVIASNVDATGDPMGWKLIDVILWCYAIMSFYFIIATRFHYSHDVWVGFLITYYFFKYYHFYVKSLAMRSGSFASRFMRWFEGVDLSQHNIIREQQDLEAGGAAVNGMGTGRDHDAATGLDGSALTAHNLAVAADATKHNRTLGTPPPAALLPVSYLEGREYYRAGHPNAGALYKGGGHNNANPAAKLEAADKRYSTSMQKDDGSQHTVPAGAGAPGNAGWESNSEMSPVRVHVGSDRSSDATVAAGEAPHRHNFNQVGGMPILTAGEHAEQERREIERETGARIG